MDKIIIIVAAAFVALATWFLVMINQPELEAPTPSGVPTTQTEKVYDFGDAPEYDNDNPETQVLYNGTDIQPLFPTQISYSGDDWYISHSSPFSQVFLGEITSVEQRAEVVNRDDDDGLLTEILAPCENQSIELYVTIPFSYSEGTEVYLNALFDWTQNGAWAGSSPRCGFEVPEWGIQNLRLDQDPYFLTEPGVYQIQVPLLVGGGGNVWSRFTVTTEPVMPDTLTTSTTTTAMTTRAAQNSPLTLTSVGQIPNTQAPIMLAQNNGGNQEWNGQGQFGPGETEDWVISVLENHQPLDLPDSVPVINTGSPLPPEERDEKSKEKKEKQKGNNGLGNGLDPQPPGNPPCNDCEGTGPGNPGNKGGPNKDEKETGKDKDKEHCDAGRGTGDEEASEDCVEGDPGKSAGKNAGGDENSPNQGKGKDKEEKETGKDKDKDKEDKETGKDKDKEDKSKGKGKNK